MFGNLLIAVGVAIAVSGCTRPRTLERVPSNESPTGPQRELLDCRVRFAASGACLNWGWQVRPTLTTEGTLWAKVARANAFDQSAVLLDGDLSLLLWMPSMGHGSSPTRTERIDVGTYLIHDVSLFMTGDWELRFERVTPELREEALVSIHVD